MSNIVDFPGVTKLDMPADNVLKAALAEGLQTAIVIGYDKDGVEYFASSVADGGTVLWLMERMKKRLLDVENFE